MNKRIATAALSAVIAGSAYSAPFLAVGTSSEVFVTADVSLSFNDNVTLGNDFVAPGATTPFNEVRDDVVFRFAPGVSFEFGRNALMSGKLAYVENIDVYQDNSDLDTALSNVTFDATHDDGSAKTSVRASYRQLNQNTVDARLPDLSRRDESQAKIDHEMEISAKSSIMFGVDWRDTDYSRDSLVDRNVTQIPLRYYWEATPKVDLSFGGAYRRTDTDFANSSSDDILLNIGARGDFTPKLKGFVRVGFADRSLDNGAERASFNMSSNLTYLYSEKTTLNFGIGNDFGSSGIGENQENFDVFLGFRSEIAADFALRGRISYREIDYFSRGSDGYTQGSLGGEYIVNEYLQVHGTFSYSNNDADLVSGDFDNTIFSVMAKLRY
jgi:polysaccharide biosynthesis protein VpsM